MLGDDGDDNDDIDDEDDDEVDNDLVNNDFVSFKNPDPSSAINDDADTSEVISIIRTVWIRNNKVDINTITTNNSSREH